MKSISLLILTDHRTHSKHNSFYGLYRAFAKHPKIKHLSVASRKYSRNAAFFSGQMDASLWASSPAPLTFEDWVWLAEEKLTAIEINDFDLVFLRLPEPSPDAFFLKLEKAYPEVLFINRPSGIFKVGSKAYLTNFPSLCPPIQVVHSPEEALSMSETMDIVLKPLRNYGGKGMLKIEKHHLYQGNEKHELTKLHQIWDPRGSMLAMRYLPNLSAGDKRTVVANGRIMFSTVRYPPPNSWICNVAQGGNSEMSSPTHEEEEMAAQLTKQLRKEGIIFFGFDTLLNDEGQRKLSEINVQSIGGIVPAEKASKKPLSEQIVRELLSYASHQLS